MYGKRARIGLIVPASNTVCEPESVLLGRACRAVETACEAVGDPCCRFTLSGG